MEYTCVRVCPYAHVHTQRNMYTQSFTKQYFALTLEFMFSVLFDSIFKNPCNIHSVLVFPSL